MSAQDQVKSSQDEIISNQDQVMSGQDTEQLGWRRREVYSKLIKNLFNNYSTIIPPNADDATTPVNIRVMMALESISYLDTRQQILNMFAWFRVTWVDPALAWDVRFYPVDVLYLSNNFTWRPDLVVYNSMQPRDLLMKMELNTEVYPSGLVVWSPGDSLETICNVDIRTFPFDTQVCDLQIGPWTQYDVVNGSCGRLLNVPVQSSEWRVTHVTCERVEENEEGRLIWYFLYNIALERKSSIYFLSLLLPIALLSVLTYVVFLLPVQSGEKMEVSLTTFLALVYFMTMLQDNLPDNSEHVCYLNVFLIGQLFLNVLVIFVSAVTVVSHYKPRDVVGASPVLEARCRDGDEDFQECTGRKMAAPCCPPSPVVKMTSCDVDTSSLA